jgi:hypothetical protein
MREMINRTTKIQKKIFAIPTALAAIPPKPNMAAIIAIIKKTIAKRIITQVFLNEKR